MAVMCLVKLLVQVYISLIADKVELDEQCNIVAVNGNPIDEIVQESLDENEDFTQTKQVIIDYYTM